MVPYLHALGITDLYLSPVLAAAPGSSHGYDVVAHDRVSEELGGEEAFRALAAACAARGMGILLDFVPNHMGIGPHNRWWTDVLENGPSSVWAPAFDPVFWLGLRTVTPRLPAISPVPSVEKSSTMMISLKPWVCRWRLRIVDAMLAASL